MRYFSFLGHMTSVVLGLVLLAGSPVGLYAQGGQSDQVITGTVVDPTGAVVPDAAVTVRHVDTGATSEVATNNRGIYRTPPLKIGNYEVEVVQSGFKTLIRRGITLRSAEIVRLDLMLELGDAAETVEVMAAAPLLTTEDARISEVIDEKTVESMPLLDRRAGGLLALAPGVYYEGQDPQSFYSPRYTLGGSANAILVLDGAPAGSDRIDVSQMPLNPPLESIQELQVQTGYFGAETGGQEAGIIALTTKSGGNEIHGSIYEYARNTVFDTRSFFATDKQVDQYHLFGGSLGGPIKKDKLFFYGTIEGTKQKLPNSAIFTIATNAMKSGDFSELYTTDTVTDILGRNFSEGQIFDPATTRVETAGGIDSLTGLAVGIPSGGAAGDSVSIREPFVGNDIIGGLPAGSSSIIDPVAIAAASFMPSVTASPLTVGGNYPARWGNEINRYAWTFKMDYVASPKDTFTWSWMYDRTSMDITGQQGWGNVAAIPSPLEDAFPYKLQHHLISYTRTISPTIVNQFRFQFRPRWWEHAPPGLDPESMWANQLGVQNVSSQALFPSFGFSGYLGMGPAFGQFDQNPVSMTEIAETLTMIRGKHTIKIGIDIQRSIHQLKGAFFPSGSFRFGSELTAQPGLAGTGDSFAAFMLGAVGTGNLRDDGEYEYKLWYAAPYFTDTMRLTNKFSLTLGLRWDVDGPTYDRLGNKFSGFDFSSMNPVSNAPGVITFHGITANTPTGLYNTDWNRFQPRISFAYQLQDKTVIRGGYGIYSIAPVTFAIQGIGYTQARVSFNSVDGGTTPIFLLRDGFPPWDRGGDPSTLTPAFGSVAVGESPTTSPHYIQPDWQFGYSQSLTLSLQRELPHQLLVEVAGAGNLGRHLTMGVNQNQLPNSLWGVAGNRQALRPFPQFGNVTDIKAPEGLTNHWALQLRATKRVTHGLLFLTSYNWQKTTGIMNYEAFEDHNLSRTAGVLFNESNGPSSIPFRLFKLAWAYDLPAGTGRQFLTSGPASWILGGWNIGGIWSWYGGPRFNLSSPSDSLNCFCGAGGRLNVIGELNLDNPTRTRWFNTDAVEVPDFGDVGTLGLGTLTGPDFRNIDLSISKVTKFGEKINLKFFWEMFNMTNTAKFGTPGRTFGSSNFGVVEGFRGIGANGGFSIAPWYGARIMQLGLRLGW